MTLSRLAFALPLLLCAVSFAADPVVNLDRFPADEVWRAANSEVHAAEDDQGHTIWRWQIDRGNEAFLWLNEKLPIHADLQHYQRFLYDVNFAEGRIDVFWPRTTGVLPPPFDKLFGEWNLFYFTHPHQTWLSVQQILNDPSWNSTAMSGIPDSVSMDRSRVLGFVCLPKTDRCVVELRNCRLVTDRIRLEKPYLTQPIGWPRRTQSGYRTTYQIKNVSDRAVKVTTDLRSKHQWFDITTDPPASTIDPGKTASFDVVAKFKPGAPPMTEETADVWFVPDDQSDLAYRTQTFCTAPLPDDAQRMVMYTPAELADLKSHPPTADAQWWLDLDLSRATEIPTHVGHRVVYGIPATCDKCKKGTMQIGPGWLDVTCTNCGYTEHHTPVADATWVATWSEIHQNGHSPLSLGRAYLATGDERYAKKAIELLALLARHYSEIPWHNAGYPTGWEHEEPPGPDAWANGASARWGNSPTYGTDFMVQGLAMLHNMIVNSPSWTDRDRALVHDGLWVPVVTEMIKIVPGISNMNDIINRDLILIGFSTSDANIVYRGTLYPTGIAARMTDISPDGFSDEGSALNYHFGAMQQWLPSIKLLSTSGMNWGDLTRRAIAAVKMPLLRASLNGTAYCTGNSGVAWHHVPLDHPMFQLADEIFPESVWQRKRAYSSDPILFRDAGWAILRTGKTAEEQIQLDFDFGRSHGHGDLDRMNLGLFAFGSPLSADPGSAYNFNTNAIDGPAVASMTSPFVANTIVVDGKQQLRGAGKLLKWNITPDAQTVSADIEGIYPGVKWRRTVTLKSSRVTVTDELTSSASHRYESAWHFLGHGRAPNQTKLDQPLGEGDYKTLLNAQRLPDGPVDFTWNCGNVQVKLHQDSAPNQLAYTAQTGICWDNTRGLPVDGVFTRREGNNAIFVTVLEPQN